LVPFVGLLAAAIFAGHGRHAVWFSMAATAVVVAALFFLTVTVERWTTGRPPAAIGFDPTRASRDLSSGVAFGALLCSFVIAVLALAGAYRVAGVNPTWDLALAVPFFALGAAFEELLFRGVLFRLIEEWAGTWIALAISAVLFGAAHAFNPGATWISTVAIALEAGVLLAVTFVVTRNLWLPIGLHFAWNFCEGPIYGAQVSGSLFLKSLLVAKLSGPAWLSGGAFGPEAGAVAIVVSLVTSTILLSAHRKKISKVTLA